MTLSQKRQSNLMIKLSIQLSYFASHEYTTLSRIIDPLAAFFDKARKTECRISSDEDLKLSDTFRADFWNSAECKDLLLRRIKNYVAADKSFKALTKAKQTNLNVAIADDQYQQDLNKFDSISESAKSELNRQNSERIDLYNKNLTAYCDLQINHLKDSF
ncbi:hypothetical protein HZS_1759 [Henneguya salminicola]|nr:hypothetical protein HZS_1759 [Henneguya salminicola]